MATPWRTRRETTVWPVQRWRMLWVLCLLAGCGGNPVDELARQLQDHDVDVRRQAAATLVKMGGDAKPAISALNGALSDKDREVRRLASRALGHLGPEAASCVNSLCQSLHDDELSVRLAAAFAIQDLDPAEKTHTMVLIEAMKMGEGGVIVAIAQYGENAVWAVPTLVSLLKDRRAGIRRIAADALRQIGPAAGAAQDALRQAAKEDVDDRVRDAAKEALAAVRPTAAT